MNQYTPDDIEAQLARDRSALAEDAAALRAKLAPAQLLVGGARLIAGQAGPAARQTARSVGRAVRANPWAFGLIGAGLAWLVLGGRKRSTAPARDPLAGTHHEAIARWEDEGGPVREAPDEAPEEIPDWMVEADGMRSRAAALFGQIEAAARTGLVPVAELARQKADVLAALTRDVRAALGRGLGDLGAQARDAALAARETAYEARVAATRAGAGAVRENPILTGGLLAVAGAALAAALPRSGTEARTMGGLRNHLMDAAQAFFADEVKRAGGIARDLADTLQRDLEQQDLDRARQRRTAAAPGTRAEASVRPSDQTAAASEAHARPH